MFQKINNFVSSIKKINALFLFIILSFVFVPLLSQPENIAFWFHEHFFNTLEIVQNFKELGFPTFDGITSTNDFSPIWAGILFLFSYIFPVTSLAYFLCLRIILGFGAIVTLYLLQKLIKRLSYTPTPATIFIVSAYQLALYFYIAITGTDFALAIPAILLCSYLGLSAFENSSFKTGFIFGLSILFCLLINASTAIYFLTLALVFYFQFNRKGPITVKQLLILAPALIVAISPILYWIYFQEQTLDSILPSTLFSWTKDQEFAPWNLVTYLFIYPLRYFSQSVEMLAFLTFPALTLGLVAHASYPWESRPQTPKDTFFYALIWFPILSLVLIATLTYTTIPTYAFYSLAVGTPFALLFVVNKINTQVNDDEKIKANKAWIFTAFALCVLSITQISKPRYIAYSKVAETISEFAKQNKGRYAISKTAGMTAYLSGKDFVRLDGYAMDKKILDLIEKQEPIHQALKTYHADYYVVINTKNNNDCYSVREPAQNSFGGSNKGMNDWLCAKPVYEKNATPKTKISIFKINQDGKAY